MQIDLSKIDIEQFKVQERDLNGEKVYLATPQEIGTKFTQDNKHFRSSLWNAEGNLISAGFPKFPNWGENPENFPVPETLDDANLIEKIDGSLLIVSRYKDTVIVRTRGTVDARQLENGFEIQTLRDKYPDVFDTAFSHCSMLYEWVSPTNQIVIKHAEPELYLVGAVHHDDYRLATQDSLNYSANILKVKRPRIYNYNIMGEMMDAIYGMKDMEGLVVYSSGDQVLHKVKSAWYLSLHRFRSGLNLRHVLELYVEMGRPFDFVPRLAQQFDFECAEMARGYAEQILDANTKAVEVVQELHSLLRDYKNADRKTVALALRDKLPAYAGYGFSLLDGKELNWSKLLGGILCV